MALFFEKTFLGRLPRISPRRLPEGYAQLATDCRLGSGALEPIPDNEVVQAAETGVQSIYRFPFGSGYWFQWLTDVDVVRSPIPGDTSHRTIYTGDGIPKETDSSIAVGSAPYPAAWIALGIPAPVTAPTVTMTGDSGEVVESRFYFYTDVTAGGKESRPSPISGQVDVKETPGTITLDSFAVAPTGNYDLGTGAKRRIYRTSGGSAGEFLFVAEIEYTTTSFVDAVEEGGLDYPCPTVEWSTPPDDLRGLVLLPNGSLAGFVGNEVFFSEPYKPYAWPDSYRITIDGQIIALSVVSGGLVVLTDGKPTLIVGSDPASMSPTQMELSQSCASKRSVADAGLYAVYASPDGIVAASGSVSKVISKEISRPFWQSLMPSSIHGYVHDEEYIGFYEKADSTKGGFVFGLKDGAFTDLSFYADGGYTDLETDTLYLIAGGNIVEYMGAGTVRPALWRSREFELGAAEQINCAKVRTTTYPVTFSVFDQTGAQLGSDVTVNNADPFWLEGFATPEAISFQVAGSSVVHAAGIASSFEELGRV